MGTQLRVYLRDILSGEWISYSTEDWLPQYYARINDALVQQQLTMGGTIAITGTPEQGRITVNDADRVIILDMDWRTKTIGGEE
ncbi:hypothetical protein ACT17_15410 [Mycolicibacterium conceptionense]|uniref:Uncharacterized protein n=2 Tax=Mycolicibacterium conceptionense TaxID=451644 RepID=A0A0J8UBH2_9MYCO|nr:hypothetical protein ACT17_15410 [Mycolicibacterium conceptionense]